MLGIEQDDATDPVMMSLAERLENLREFRARLLSPRISAFVLVLVAERLPIEETARAIEQLKEAGVTIGGLVVNRVLPDDQPRSVPALASRPGSDLSRRDRTPVSSHARVRVPQLPSDVHGVQDARASRRAPHRGESASLGITASIMIIKRPDQSEFAPFYAGYIGKVPDSGPVPLLKEQIGELEKLRVAARRQGQSRLRRPASGR